MKIIKSQMEQYINSFDGEYKEIFLEQSKSLRMICINGKFKTPSFSTLEGMNIISRIGKEEYFKSFSDIAHFSQYIGTFQKEFSLGKASNKISLQGEDELSLTETEQISFDVVDVIQHTQKIFQDEIQKCSFISSSEISLLLSHKSFVVANSKGKFQKDVLFYNTYFIKLVGEKEGVREEIYEKITGTDIFHTFHFDNLQKTIKKTLLTLEKQLSSHVGPDGKMDVIIGNEAGGTIIHEAVGHGLEADLQNSSVYKNKIGEKVASSLVTVVDNPTIENERGFYRFDHEGNEAKNTVLIENGILKSYLHNEKTAHNFGISSTGHGRRESYKHKTMVRMGNTYLMPGNDTKKSLIERVNNGIYVSRMGGGQVNTSTGDFVFKVQNGFLIENGKLSHPIRGATISGNGPEMLQEIYGICDDLHFFDGGTCGKGQNMPVSDGTPTILTRLKVTSIKA